MSARIGKGSRIQQGLEAFRSGRLGEAERRMRQVLKEDAQSPDALHILGILAAKAGKLGEAETLLQRCVASAPGFRDAHNNLGNVLMAQGRYAKAQTCYEQAMRLDPRASNPVYNLGNCLRARGKLNEAEDAYRRALRLQPGYVGALVGLGNVLREQGAYEDAEGIYLELLRAHPNLHEVHLNLGNVYRLRGDYGRACLHYEELLRRQPNHARAWLSLALIWIAEHDLQRAWAAINQAQAIANAPAHECLAAIASWHLAIGDKPAALDAVTKAVALGASQPEYLLRIADIYADMRCYQQAIDSLSTCMSRFGDHPSSLLGKLVEAQRNLCDWRQWPELMPKLIDRIKTGDGSCVSPFGALSLPGLEAGDLLKVARATGKALAGSADGHPMPAQARLTNTRLRVGYLSGDLRAHAVGYVTAAVFELHDREQFEIFAYDIGPQQEGPQRSRLRQAFDQFIDLNPLSDQEAADRIREDGIDILVDLNGYTAFARTRILARRPAPIQVNWLGFPGSMGASCVDYLVADRIVIPPEDAGHYDESLAYVAHCYLPVDCRREVAVTPNRSQEDLPEQGFVFCSFNNLYKITPDLFAAWCDLLQALPGSVLWLSTENEEARANLRREAEGNGVEAGRLIFAARRPEMADHLARLRLADLFLDTAPYNAHSTAIDALWAGVPVLTYSGQTFPSRVAASLLTAAEMPDLIATDREDYLRKAVWLATHPTALKDYRARLAAARDTAPLFDCSRFTRDLEVLYQRMWARHQEGLPPAPIGL